MENFPNWKYNLPNLCSFEALSLEKVHDYFGFLLTFSYLCNRQESINNAESAQMRFWGMPKMPINKGILKEIEWQIPVLKVQGLNPCGITRDRRSQSIFEKSFDYRESSVKEVQSTIALLGRTASSVPWGDASPKNTLIGQELLHQTIVNYKIFFLTK